MWLQTIGLVFGGLFLYCVGGSLTVIATAYVMHRVFNINWFNTHRKWTDGPHNIPYPIFVFLFWPLAIPVSIIWFLVNGVAELTEKIGDRVIQAAETQRTKIGSYRDNPK